MSYVTNVKEITDGPEPRLRSRLIGLMIILASSILSQCARAHDDVPGDQETIFVCEESLIEHFKNLGEIDESDPWATEYNHAGMLERETIYIDERTALEHVLWEERWLKR